MDLLIKQMLQASRANLYFAALTLALTLPDIFAALGAENGRSSGSKYRRWVEANLGYTPGEATNLYGFRCSLLHQGVMHPHRAEYPIAFLEPSDNSPQLHRLTTEAGGEKVVWLSVPLFVEEVADAGSRWLAEYGDTAVVGRNMARFARRRPEGLPPHVVGATVIA